MSDYESMSELVLSLAEEFVERCRRGEQPSLSEYMRRYPELAAEIEEVFPTMAMMERVAPTSLSLDRDGNAHARQIADLEVPRLADYRVIREIGRGGMGVVYEAEQVSLGRHVALKVLPKQFSLDSPRRHRFEREARAAARLHHTNIVPVFGVGRSDGLHYYVMQFIQGLGLDEILEELKKIRSAADRSQGTPGAEELRVEERGLSAADAARSLLTGRRELIAAAARSHGEARGQDGVAWEIEPQVPAPTGSSTPVSRLSDTFSLSNSSALRLSVGGAPKQPATKAMNYWYSVAKIGTQVASALEYAHSQGILHRDIKPSNLLLDTRGTVWVTDFGLAKLDDQFELTRTGDLVGTLRYMAPEALDGRGDCRSDVYSLGLTLYELLALRPAYDERDRKQLVKLLSGADAPRLDRVNAEIPRDLVTVVHKAIDRDPERRYQTAGELETDLLRFLDDLPVRARRLTAVQRLGRWSRRNPVIVGLLAAIMGTLSAGAATATHYALRATKNEQAAVANERRAIEKEREAVQQALLAREAQQTALDARLQMRENLYLAEMNLAGQAANDDGGIGRVNELLEHWWPAPGERDLRGWEWYYLYGLGRQAECTLTKHAKAVRCIRYSPDGLWFAAIGDAGTIQLWAAAGARHHAGFQAHAGGGISLAFHPDEPMLASTGRDLAVRIWNLDTLTERTALGGSNKAFSDVSFSPDGRRLAASNYDGLIRIWDVKTWQQSTVCRGHTDHVYAAVFSPDGRRLASGSADGTARFWDVDTGRQIDVCPHPDWVNALAWSPDARQIATACSDGRIRIWDVPVGEDAGPVQRAGGAPTEAEKPPPREPVAILSGHTFRAECVSFSADGTRLATGAKDQTVRLWDVATRKQVDVLRGHTHDVHSLAWAPDGRTLITASGDHTVRIWNVASGDKTRAVTSVGTDVNTARWSPDGRRLATASERAVTIWEADDWEEVARLEHPETVWELAWSPNGQCLAVGGAEPIIHVWNTVTAQEIARLAGHKGHLEAIEFSHDGRRLASGSIDRSIRIWDAATFEPSTVLGGHEDGITSLAWGPGGSLLSVGADRTIRSWDVTAGKQASMLHQNDWLSDIRFNSEGSRFSIASFDHTVGIWHWPEQRRVGTLSGHTHWVLKSSWSPDGKRLATASDDGTVRIWDASAGKEVIELFKRRGVHHGVEWNADGRRLVCVSPDSTARIFNSLPGQLAARLDEGDHAGDRFSVPFYADGQK